MRALTNIEASVLEISIRQIRSNKDDQYLTDEQASACPALVELGYLREEYYSSEYEETITTELGKEALRIFNMVKPFLNT
jgi:hypothetical protein